VLLVQLHRRLQRIETIRMPTGPRDPLTEFGARLRRLALGLGAPVDLVDERADLVSFGPGFDLALEKLAPLQLLALSLLGFDAPPFCLPRVALLTLLLESLGALGVGHDDEAEHHVVQHVFEPPPC